MRRSSPRPSRSPAITTTDTKWSPGEPNPAELLYEAGRFEEALPIHLSFLSGYDTDGLYVIGPAYLRRAQIYEALGDEEKAVDFYKRFIDLWRDADPEFQPLVIEARASLDALYARSVAERQS